VLSRPFGAHLSPLGRPALERLASAASCARRSLEVLQAEATQARLSLAPPRLRPRTPPRGAGWVAGVGFLFCPGARGPEPVGCWLAPALGTRDIPELRRWGRGGGVCSGRGRAKNDPAPMGPGKCAGTPAGVLPRGHAPPADQQMPVAPPCDPRGSPDHPTWWLVHPYIAPPWPWRPWGGPTPTPVRPAETHSPIRNRPVPPDEPPRRRTTSR
jgi:hypothetical protein